MKVPGKLVTADTVTDAQIDSLIRKSDGAERIRLMRLRNVRESESGFAHNLATAKLVAAINARNTQLEKK